MTQRERDKLNTVIDKLRSLAESTKDVSAKCDLHMAMQHLVAAYNRDTR